ncbi:transcription initiation factor IIB [Halobacteriales archaeon QS_1_68_17]|nr:MAG: transcription initiation factor IIB [Halobacteriales archaeon QS_1_68_17]
MATSDISERRFDEDVPGATTSSCPECSGRVRTNAVETSCEDCGLVLDETPIDHGPEWRSFEDDGTEPERTGAPITPTRHDRGLSTEIGRKTDAKGNALPGKKRRQLGRLRREHNRGRWRSKAERNLAIGLSEVRRVASALDVSDSIHDQSCSLFRSAQNEDLLRGRSIEAMAVASVYAACRCNRLPWTIAEVCEVSRVSRERVENAYRVLNQELGLPAVPPTPRQYVPRIVSDLELSDETRRSAERLAERAEGQGLANGRNPAGVAAGCLYEAARRNHEDIAQRKVGERADVSAMTVRERWREIQSLDSGSDEG